MFVAQSHRVRTYTQEACTFLVTMTSNFVGNADYQVRDGVTVPMTGEVAWLGPAGRRPYFRGTVTSLIYDEGLRP